jgi:predicted neuraminidase
MAIRPRAMVMTKVARIASACVLSWVAVAGAQETSRKPAAIDANQPDGMFRSSVTVGMEEAYLGRLFPISHAANLVKLKNGDLLCFWFSGTGEGQSNVAIVMSRLTKGSEQWGKTVEIDHQLGKSFQNPVGFQSPDGRVWLMHTSQPAGEGQTNAQILYLTSDDDGQTWSLPRPLFTQPGSFVRHPPILLSRKNWLLPMYYTPSRTITEGAESHYSVVKITNDSGKHWRECRIPGSNGLVQETVVRLGTGQFLGFFRSRYADFIYQSTSQDGCTWIAPAPTRLPNNNSSIQMTLLKDSSLILAFNNVNSGTTRDKPRASARKPLSIALSEDGGATWPWVRDIETGSAAIAGSTQDDSKRGRGDDDYSYPSVLEDQPGRITVAYTYRRETIKVVRFDKDWIKSGGTTGIFKGDSAR